MILIHDNRGLNDGVLRNIILQNFQLRNISLYGISLIVSYEYCYFRNFRAIVFHIRLMKIDV